MLLYTLYSGLSVTNKLISRKYVYFFCGTTFLEASIKANKAGEQLLTILNFDVAFGFWNIRIYESGLLMSMQDIGIHLWALYNHIALTGSLLKMAGSL